MTRPDRTEAADYYWTYIDKVGDGAICDILRTQLGDVTAFLSGISDEQSLHRYAPDKWSIRDVVGHVNDAERVFSHRAFWFARGYSDPLPSFEQDTAVAHAHADDRSWRSLIDEFRAVREASVTLFDSLPSDAWTARGMASGNPFSVRALAHIVAGHVNHHLGIIRDRYL